MKKIAALLLFFFAVVPLTANATPILWTMECLTGCDGGNPAGPFGTFKYDSDTDLFTDVSIAGFLEFFDSFTATSDSEFFGTGTIFGALAEVTLDQAMSNAGGVIDGSWEAFVFSSTQPDFFGDLQVSADGVSSVPEPGTLGLLGAGLLGLGFMRRKRQSAYMVEPRSARAFL